MATLELDGGKFQDFAARGTNGALHVALGDTETSDAFNRMRVSQPTTLFDSQQEYGMCTSRCWNMDANGTREVRSSDGYATDGAGNLVGPRDVNTRLCPITATATDGHYAVLQTQLYIRYIPGKSHLVYIAGVFAADADYEASLVVRSSTSGSVSDANAKLQSEWSIDKFDGHGPSETRLDFTKVQIMVIDLQWLGAGRVRVGFDIGGRIFYAHEFNQANVGSVPYMQSANLPIRHEMRTDATYTYSRAGYFDAANGPFLQIRHATKGGTTYFECASVQSEGGVEARGFPLTRGNGVTGVAVTTRRPVLSIRPRAIYNTLTNRGHIEPASFEVMTQTKDVYYEVILGGTLTGASWVPNGTAITAGSFTVGVRYTIATVGTTNFTLIGAASNTVGVEFVATGVGTGTGTATPNVSIADYDVTASAITGGVMIASGYAIAGTGSSKSGASSEGVVEIRSAVSIAQIDAGTCLQPNITIVATSLDGTTATVRGTIHWHEQVI